jgi:hypothetical protein
MANTIRADITKKWMILNSDPSAAGNKGEKSLWSLLQQVSFLSRACYPNNKTKNTKYEK